MGDVVQLPIKFRPRLIQEGRTPAEDLEFALKQAWDRQKLMFSGNRFLKDEGGEK
jgi:hypothetical protein